MKITIQQNESDSIADYHERAAAAAGHDASSDLVSITFNHDGTADVTLNTF